MVLDYLCGRYLNPRKRIKMPSILDLMPKEDADKVLEKAKKRALRAEGTIPYPIYALAEFGYYYGWQAIQDVRENKISIDEMNVLLEGARKVWYSKLVEQGGMQVVSGSFRSGSKTYEDAIRPYKEKAQ